MADQIFVAQQMNRAFQLFAQGLTLTDAQAMEIADLYEPWAEGKKYATGTILKHGVKPSFTPSFRATRPRPVGSLTRPRLCSSPWDSLIPAFPFGHSPLEPGTHTTPGTRFPIMKKHGFPPWIPTYGNPVCMVGRKKPNVDLSMVVPFRGSGADCRNP